MAVQIFLSTVSDEFRAYRDQLRSDLTRHNVEVKVQDDFKDRGGVTLDKLDLYIAACDAVVHLVGDMTGAEAKPASVKVIRAKYPDLTDKLPSLSKALGEGVGTSYTQWEAWLALYHGKMLLIARADDAAPRESDYAATDASRAAQRDHLDRLREVERYPGCTFTNSDQLASYVLGSAILDLLAKQRALEQQTDPNRRKMLAKVRQMWIDGYLKPSLHNLVHIELKLEENSASVSRPWDLIVQQPDQAPEALPPDETMGSIFERLGQALLILGARGAGKTTLLLELGRDLLDRAERDTTHPIPVVLHLSSWAMRQRPLEDWLVDELAHRYYVPLKLAQAWVTAEQVLPLLDGLDEVAPEHRVACVEAINTFRRQHGLVPLAVCSRMAEYEALSVRAVLTSAIVIKPLSRDQIDIYINKAGTALAGVQTVLREDITLWEVLETPLMLSIVTLVYWGQSAEDLRKTSSLEQRRAHLFQNYIGRMFERRTEVKEYTKEQSTRWLGWLARSLKQNNLSIFYVEWMQPDWLPSRAQRSVLVTVPIIFSGLALQLHLSFAM